MSGDTDGGSQAGKHILTALWKYIVRDQGGQQTGQVIREKEKWLLTSSDRADREAEAAWRARPGPTRLAHRMDVTGAQTEVRMISNTFIF